MDKKEWMEVDINELIQSSENSTDQDLIDTIHTRVLGMKEWLCFTPAEVAKEGINGGKSGIPYMVANYNGRRALFVFSSEENISRFLKAHMPEVKNIAVFRVDPKSIINESAKFAEDGIEVLLFDDSWQIPMDVLLPTYHHYVPPYDFEELIREAKKKDTESIVRLWVAALSIPQWFFIGNRDIGFLSMIDEGPFKFIQVLPTFRSAKSEVMRIRSEGQPQAKVMPMSVVDAMGFLHYFREKKRVLGIVLGTPQHGSAIDFESLSEFLRRMEESAKRKKTA